MATVADVMDALAAQIQSQLSGTSDPVIENLQAHGRLNFNPTPPAVDVYPADPFVDRLTFGKGNITYYLTVRARVSTADSDGGQGLLLSMMDPDATTSMERAIVYDRTLGGKISKLNIHEGPSAYGVFPDPSGQSGSLIGCTWTVRVVPT